MGKCINLWHNLAAKLEKIVKNPEIGHLAHTKFGAHHIWRVLNLVCTKWKIWIKAQNVFETLISLQPVAWIGGFEVSNSRSPISSIICILSLLFFTRIPTTHQRRQRLWRGMHFYSIYFKFDWVQIEIGFIIKYCSNSQEMNPHLQTLRIHSHPLRKSLLFKNNLKPLHQFIGILKEHKKIF